MWAVEHTPLAEEAHANSGTCSLADLGAELEKQRFDVPPGDVGADRPAEDSSERLPVPAPQGAIVSNSGTIFKPSLANPIA